MREFRIFMPVVASAEFYLTAAELGLSDDCSPEEAEEAVRRLKDFRDYDYELLDPEFVPDMASKIANFHGLDMGIQINLDFVVEEA